MPVRQHPVSYLLHTGQPNDDMTPMVFRETFHAGGLTWGNSYAEIETDGRGAPSDLIPRHPSRVRPFRDDDDPSKPLLYEITGENGKRRVVERDQMLHVPGLGGDGIVGWSPIRLFAEAIGMGLAAERFGARFYGHAARPSGVISRPQPGVPGRLGPEHPAPALDRA